jgi:hypothetical protein
MSDTCIDCGAEANHWAVETEPRCCKCFLIWRTANSMPTTGVYECSFRTPVNDKWARDMAKKELEGPSFPGFSGAMARHFRKRKS